VELIVGSKNNTVKFYSSFDLDFTAIVNPACQHCSKHESYQAEESQKDGFLNFTTNKTEVYKFFYHDEFLFLHGRWAVESVLLPGADAKEKIYNKALLHKVFIIDDIQRLSKGVNISAEISEEGIIGLSGKSDPKTEYESYAEYLKRRKLVKLNTLSIDLNVTTK
jgi:hypothetical protein